MANFFQLYFRLGNALTTPPPGLVAMRTFAAIYRYCARCHTFDVSLHFACASAADSRLC